MGWGGWVVDLFLCLESGENVNHVNVASLSFYDFEYEEWDELLGKRPKFSYATLNIPVSNK